MLRAGQKNEFISRRRRFISEICGEMRGRGDVIMALKKDAIKTGRAGTGRRRFIRQHLFAFS